MNDPVMYIVVREQLQMSIGKTAAQCCHAVEGALEKARGNEKLRDTMSAWRSSGRTKIVLAADDKEWIKLLESTQGIIRSVVIDQGRTELEPGTMTVVAFVPLERGDRPSCLKRLQLL